MALHEYQDIASTNGHTRAYETSARMLLHGWTTYAKSDGTTRTTSTNLTSAAELNASNAFVLLVHTATGFKLGMQRKADSNTWTVQVTEGGQSLSGGNATTMDSNATYTKTFLSNAQWYPSTGTTNTKLHIVVDDASPSIFEIARRTPFVGGSTSGCSMLMIEWLTPMTWAANPQPWVGCAKFDNSDIVAAQLTTAVNSGWYKRGISGESFSATWILNNPGNIAGSATADPGGSDIEVEGVWVSTSLNAILGKSALFRLLQPFRSPITGVDSGATLNRAAFGQVTTVANGTALAS